MSSTHSITREQARLIDRRAIEEFGLPELVLMENAGRGAAELFLKLNGAGPVLICCGKGNNGGDGLVMARHLELRGVEVRVVVVAREHEMSPSEKVHFQLGKRALWPMWCWSEPDDGSRFESELARANWIVDALLGTGFSGEPRPPLDEVISRVNAAGRPVLALDLPSGLDADTGRAATPTIRAAHTATFVAPKRGFEAPGTREFTGMVHVIDIGAPRRLIKEAIERAE